MEKTNCSIWRPECVRGRGSASLTGTNICDVLGPYYLWLRWSSRSSGRNYRYRLREMCTFLDAKLRPVCLNSSIATIWCDEAQNETPRGPRPPSWKIDMTSYTFVDFLRWRPRLTKFTSGFGLGDVRQLGMSKFISWPNFDEICQPMPKFIPGILLFSVCENKRAPDWNLLPA